MLVLDRKQVESLLDMDALIGALAPAMVELSAGRVSMPARTLAEVPEQGLLGVMPAYLPSSNTLSCKLVSVFPGNGPQGLPTHQAVVMLFDAANGQALAMLDGASITALRTAAGSALATKSLAREDASVLLVVGSGVQAASHARAIPRVRKIQELRIAARDHAGAAALARELGAELGVKAKALPIGKEAFAGAQVICAATHAAEPVVEGAWLEPGMHVNSVGLNARGRELDAEAVLGARVAVESRAAALAAPPSGANDLKEARSPVEIGEILAGTQPGRQSPEEITLYKSVGVAVQDAVAARLVYEAARARDLGREVKI